MKKKKDGLGIKDLTILNKALLEKWSWRYAPKKEAQQAGLGFKGLELLGQV